MSDEEINDIVHLSRSSLLTHSFLSLFHNRAVFHLFSPRVDIPPSSARDVVGLLTVGLPARKSWLDTHLSPRNA